MWNICTIIDKSSIRDEMMWNEVKWNEHFLRISHKIEKEILLLSIGVLFWAKYEHDTAARCGVKYGGVTATGCCPVNCCYWV